MKNIILEKENGRVIDLPKTEEVIYELHNGSKLRHLCFDCVSGCASKCQKVADYRKKPITAYDFIINGYQVFDNRGNIQEFTVTKCKNYEYDAPKHLTPKGRVEAKKVKDAFHMAYFGANDLQELKEIKKNLGLNKEKKELVKTK